MWESFFSVQSARVSRWVKLLFYAPPDCFSPEGRSLQRYRRAAWTSIVMIAARISNILTGIITVPVTLNYLGEDLYGIWMALTSLVSFLSFYDFGIGTGLRNMLIECVASDDDESPRKYIGNALVVLTLLTALMIILVFTLLPFIPWVDLIKCSNPASVPQILPTAQAVLIMFALGLPITQLQNIANAYQRGYWGYLCFLVGRIFGFLFVLWCVEVKQPLWLLAAGFVGIPLLVTLIGWFVLLVSTPELRPWPVLPERRIMRRLFGTGFYVFVHTLSLLLINSSPMLIMANTINTASVVPYSVTQKLLGASNMITMSLMIGISVAVGEAWHRKDYRWIEQAIRKSEKVVFYSGILPILVFLFAGRSIIQWWLNSPDSVPNFELLLICVLLTGTISFSYIYSSCLMAMNFVRFMAWIRAAASVFFFVGGYLTGVLTHSPTLIIFCQLAIGVLIPTFLFWRKLKELVATSKTCKIEAAPSIQVVPECRNNIS